MTVRKLYADEQLIDLLKTDNQEAIEILFKQYYKQLCIVVYRMLGDRDLSEDLVQEVFLTIWKNRQKIDINISIRAYLKRATVNRTLNYIRDNKKRYASPLDDSPIKDWESGEYDGHEELEYSELKGEIEKGIESLPPRCRMVFVLSRYEQLSHKEIAQQLDISEKTVENQIGKALKIMRSVLSRYL
ncbi:MAG: RNA polymerase sigma-70 factor [Bacteroidota bacterium]